MYSNTFKKGRLYKQCMVHQASLKWIFKKCHVFVYFLQAFAINPLLPSMTVVDSRLSFLADTATGLMFYDTKDVCATYQCTRKFNLGQGQCQCYQVNVRQRVSQCVREYHRENDKSFGWFFSFFHSLTKVLFRIIRELSERHNNVSKWRLHEYWGHGELLLLLPIRPVREHV